MLFYLILFLQPTILIGLSHKKDAPKYNTCIWGAFLLPIWYFRYASFYLTLLSKGYGTNFDANAIGE
jgi:hypothetical protein